MRNEHKLRFLCNHLGIPWKYEYTVIRQSDWRSITGSLRSMLALALVFVAGILSAFSTPLDDYVWAADPAYTWNEIEGGRFEGKGYKGYTLVNIIRI